MNPVPGVDYEPSGCPICGGTTPPSAHKTCLKSLGVWPRKWEEEDE